MSARLTNWLNAPARGPRRMSPGLVAALTADTALIHSCLIGTRAQEVDEDDDDAPLFDAYEEPIMGDYAPTLSPPTTATGERVACFAWQPQPSGNDGEVSTEDSAYVAHRWHFLFPVGTTALVEDAALADVRDEDGAVIVAGPLGIREVVPRRGHLLVRADVTATGLGEVDA
jgi:hypothetical protein